MNRFLPLIALVGLASGCSVIVDGQLADKGSDAGPTGPACNTTADCLTLPDRAVDCTQVCVGAAPGSPGVCVSGRITPDGTPCGVDGTRICTGGGSRCEVSECGDGYVDRNAMPPEYCDDGDTNDTNLCNNSCTRSCVPPARPDCSDGNPCNGAEMCDTATGLCRATRPPDDGFACMVDTQSGTCSDGTCVVE